MNARDNAACLGLAGLPQDTQDGRSDRIDGLALGAPVAVIDAIALIVPMDESGTNQIGNRAADIGPP